MMQKNYGLMKNFTVSKILILLSTICYSESIDLNQSYYVYLDKLENNLQVYMEAPNDEKKYKILMQSYKKLGKYIDLQKEKKIKENKSLVIKNKPYSVLLPQVNIHNSKVLNKVNLNNSTLINTRVGNFINTNRVNNNNMQNINQNFEKTKVLLKKKKKKRKVKNIYINSFVGKNYIGN